MSNYLGFFLGLHDSNLTLVKDDQIIYQKSERLLGIKHHKADIHFVNKILNDHKIEHLNGVAYTDGNRNGLGECTGKNLVQDGLPYWNCPVFNLDHHYAHALSVWPMIELKKVKWAISIDGRGDNERRISIIKNPGTSPELVYENKNLGIAKLLMYIGEKMGLSGQPVDFAGKIMGLQSYGIPDLNYVEKSRELFKHDIRMIPYALTWHQELSYSPDDQDFKNWLATIHLMIEEYVIDLFQKFFQPDDFIAYTGGVSQNTVINMRLKRLFPNLQIPPHAYDGGLSLGCIEFLRQKNNEKFQRRFFPFWQNDEIIKDPRNEIIEKIADYLVEGKTVGWYQGYGELGPRALGNRSLLFDPRHKDGKEIVNQIKQREEWRPFAGSVLEENASEYFELEKSPYMLYACKVKKPEVLPAITHIDNTCRIQTVPYHETDGYAKLLKEFEKRTGIPILLNTSLNMGGKPIVSTVQEAIDMFKKTKMDVLCLGNKIMKKPHC